MREGTFLAAAEQLPLASLDELTGGHAVVVIAPHPDDESLGCGGLIAAACAAGQGVHVVIVSDGTGSHPNSKTHPRDRLRELRESEARTACAALGLRDSDLTFLRLPDRAVPSSGPDAELAGQTIAALCCDIEARTLFVTWPHDPHCDHAAAHAIARIALRYLPNTALYAYPVWAWSLPADLDVGEEARGKRFDISAQLERKRTAMHLHRSQVSDLIADDPEGFRLSEEMLHRFSTRPFEIFLECDG